MPKKIYIENLKKLAENKGGQCLSDEYVDSLTEYHWKCSEGHEFLLRMDYVKYNVNWCKKCANREPLTLDTLRLQAAKFDGYCLNTEYVGLNHLYTWKCKENHIWKKNGLLVRDGSWCSICWVNPCSNTIEDAINIAKKNDGYFLSEKYTTNREKYLWQCRKGHVWSATYHAVNDGGTWCPYCVESSQERNCRIIFEEVFNKKFIKIKPKWLMGLKGRLLELDGYCEELNLAFEFNGIYHYQILNVWGMNKEKFEELKERDRHKVKLCINNNVKLIVIKQNKEYMSKKEIKKAVLDELKLEGLIK